MLMYDKQWTCMQTHGHLWHVWTCMEIYENVGAYMELSDMFEHMNINENV